MHATASKSKTNTQLKPNAAPKATTKAKKAASAVDGARGNGAKPSASRPKAAASAVAKVASPKVASQQPAPASAPAGERHQNEGHGRRLTMAFEALEAFPALAESRARLLSVVSKDHVATADVVTAVESDVALIIAVLRIANQVQDGRGRVDTVVAAVELLTPQTVHGLAGRLRTFDFFERSSVWEAAPERFRLHALATQHAADRIAAEVGFENRDRLTATSLLHDIGKLVLLHAYPGYPSQVHRGARTPEERIHQERRELGVDHALVGGVLARRWGLPATIASTIERHHNPDAEGEAALVRLADMLAHYEQGAPVSPAEMLRSARVVGLGPAELRRVMYELPSVPSQRRRHVDPCPLSGRELSVLQRLAEGKVYKQIAHELTLSTSTVRTHLHNIYGKLGAVDRAQAVLIATERGWL
ncbi:MAG TPA: HDOD domain-containing protein [Solirubrobacteraceae bacterium]|jgi:putative nucleotidyltransferase with HDIG domain|nr:HDOD domain-containing protein [Solirubrobacteraceae bacterium]